MLSACIITYNELEPLKRCLSSISKHVDEYVIGVDDKTEDNTFQWLQDNNYKPFLFHFDNFSQSRNIAIDRVKTSWYFTIDSDEIILENHALLMRQVCREGDKTGIDAFYMNRRHWLDLEMTKEWFPPHLPDRQFRLMRNYIKYHKPVHEQCFNFRKASLCNLEIQHFNMFYRDAKAWEIKNSLYRKLETL